MRRDTSVGVPPEAKSKIINIRSLMILLAAEGSIVVWSSATFRIAISSKAAAGLSPKLTVQNANTRQLVPGSPNLHTTRRRCFSISPVRSEWQALVTSEHSPTS